MNNELFAKINMIYKELDEIPHISSIHTYEKFIALYSEYLKILVQIQNPIPDVKDDNLLYSGCCYLYAMAFLIPKKFEEKFQQIFRSFFPVDVGDISGCDLSDPIADTNSLLERLYSDLDYLKIKWYESDINKPIVHNGYKIAVFFENGYEDPDYHFMRQTKSGIWHHQGGYFETPLETTTPIQDNKNDGYEYVKTIEIVKPTLQRLK